MLNLTTVSPSQPPPSQPPELDPCESAFNPFSCASEQLDAEHQFLALVIVALAIAVCVLCLLICILALVVHKISVLWMTAALGSKVAGTDKSDPNDNPRKELLSDAIKSSFSSSKGKADGKKKRASFAEDTSCAPPRDVDEEDL